MLKIKSLVSHYKKFISDISLNIIAATLPLAMLQLLIYPWIAKAIGGQEYGLMLTIYSLWIMVPNSMGNVLNNIKLLRQDDSGGDIALLLRQWTVAGFVVVFVFIWMYFGTFSVIHVVIGSFIAICILLKAYLEVGFRIKLDYTAVLINNILLSVGYFIGFIAFKVTGIWEFVFLLGYLVSCVYCTVKTGLLRVPPCSTELFASIKKDAYSLMAAGIIGNLINYADKLVLYPLMGGMAVSIYYTATILGKITGMLTGPINSVILSYIARWDKSRTNVFTKVLSLSIVVCIVGYIVSLLLARPVIGLLFPQWIEKVMDIIPLTTVTVMLGILASILNPFVLKYCKMQWQIGINTIASIVYFGSALLLWNYMGLKGFCIGTIIGALTKLLIIVVAYYRSVDKQK